MHRLACCAAAFALTPAISASESLFAARSLDQGAAFDLVFTELAREPNKSIVSVPGFHQRTAAGSRWLMCRYNDLAARRGFKYWTVIYPDEPKETIAVAFHQTASEDIAKILGDDYIGANVFPKQPTEVAFWTAKLCGPPK